MVYAAPLHKWPSRQRPTFGLLRCAAQTKRSTTLLTSIIGRGATIIKDKRAVNSAIMHPTKK